MKLINTDGIHLNSESHPARGAWIEIVCQQNQFLLGNGRTPQGVRGLKYNAAQL